MILVTGDTDIGKLYLKYLPRPILPERHEKQPHFNTLKTKFPAGYFRNILTGNRTLF
ncbi:hypothetical protein X792_07980 [Dehalococcoides mccartyi CG1]|nr:hypothetical protein GY50_1487 [Dehalococcoides mccartyi GY50]AII58792.1 hypothetical protein X792_07980 [Dehalococcoides mccartyi CG1]